MLQGFYSGFTGGVFGVLRGCKGDVRGFLQGFTEILQCLKGVLYLFSGILHICYMGVPRGVQGVLKSSYRVVI